MIVHPISFSAAMLTLKECTRSFARTLLGRPLAGVYGVYYAALGLLLKEECAVPPARSPRRPIDAVYTWVNGSDATRLRMREYYREEERDERYLPTAGHKSRAYNRDELRYSLRSLCSYAPYVRSVFIVTECALPGWLNVRNPNLFVVRPEDIVTDRDALPTFNSHALETSLHHIDGLSDTYIYLNDDFFLGRATHCLDFFTEDGKAVGYLSRERIKYEPPTNADTAVTWASQNDRRLIERTFGQPLERKFLHAPYSQIRSVLYEMEQVYDGNFKETARNRFRAKTDIKIPSSLFPYYAYYSGKAILKEPRCKEFPTKYINVASPFLRATLTDILLTRRYKAFCINEPISCEEDTSKYDRIVQDFLEAYFPNKCEFEK